VSLSSPLQKLGDSFIRCSSLRRAVLQGRVGALEPELPRRRRLASSTGLPLPCSRPGLRLSLAGTILLAWVRRL